MKPNLAAELSAVCMADGGVIAAIRDDQGDWFSPAPHMLDNDGEQTPDPDEAAVLIVKLRDETWAVFDTRGFKRIEPD